MAVDHYVHHSRPGGSLEIADGLALQEKPRLKFTFQVLQEFRAAACFVKNAQDPHPGTRHPAGVCAERCRLPQQAVVVVAHPGERGVMQKPAVALGVRLHRAHTFAEAQELHLPQHRRVQRVLLAHLHLRVAVGKALQGPERLGCYRASTLQIQTVKRSTANQLFFPSQFPQLHSSLFLRATRLSGSTAFAVLPCKTQESRLQARFHFLRTPKKTSTPGWLMSPKKNPLGLSPSWGAPKSGALAGRPPLAPAKAPRRSPRRSRRTDRPAMSTDTAPRASSTKSQGDPSCRMISSTLWASQKKTTLGSKGWILGPNLKMGCF